MTKKQIEDIVKNTLNQYSEVSITNKSEMIDEPILSSGFAINLKQKNNIVFSELKVRNDFKDI